MDRRHHDDLYEEANRQFLQEHLIDDLPIAVRPVLPGAGENLFAGLDVRALGYGCERTLAGERATHVFLRNEPLNSREAA